MISTVFSWNKTIWINLLQYSKTDANYFSLWISEQIELLLKKYEILLYQSNIYSGEALFHLRKRVHKSSSFKERDANRKRRGSKIRSPEIMWCFVPFHWTFQRKYPSSEHPVDMTVIQPVNSYSSKKAKSAEIDNKSITSTIESRFREWAKFIFICRIYKE